MEVTKVFSSEELAQRLGAPPGTRFEHADAYFAANPGNNYFFVGEGSKAEDEFGDEPQKGNPLRLHFSHLSLVPKSATDPDA